MEGPSLRLVSILFYYILAYISGGRLDYGIGITNVAALSFVLWRVLVVSSQFAQTEY
jgi:hypothetical protein